MDSGRGQSRVQCWWTPQEDLEEELYLPSTLDTYEAVRDLIAMTAPSPAPQMRTPAPIQTSAHVPAPSAALTTPLYVASMMMLRVTPSPAPFTLVLLVVPALQSRGLFGTGGILATPVAGPSTMAFWTLSAYHQGQSCIAGIHTRCIRTSATLVSRHTPRALEDPVALDAADSAARTIATAITMRRSTWLQVSGIPPEVQNAIQDLPFDCVGLFAQNSDSHLHSLKDSQVTQVFGDPHPSTPKRAI
ncbi:hypothetical protein UY3_04521 [Chelonia mydas]|uniref:Uncharacterized protein n=1 Tax=Chelonia mydas TaxID=8469 RepID=M7CC70_CHEMY|nr:hypothetical protein UY3_04521 [Chelonia mydas]